MTPSECEAKGVGTEAGESATETQGRTAADREVEAVSVDLAAYAAVSDYLACPGRTLWDRARRWLHSHPGDHVALAIFGCQGQAGKHQWAAIRWASGWLATREAPRD